MPADYAEFKCVVNINIFKAFQRKDVFNAKAQRRRERKEKFWSACRYTAPR